MSLVALCQPAAGASSPPYGWYKANGHRLYLDCAGTGQPTVVLESGLGANHYTWDPVNYITGVVGTTVCVYDRYGQGSSDSPPGPGAHTRTIDQAVSDLHALLRVAGLDAPYVLVGTSMGGLIVREYARLFPKEVAGMVLLDSAPDDWDLYTGTETFTYAPESFNIAAASAALRRSDNLGSRPLAVLQAGDDSSVQSSWAKGKKDFQGYWSSRQRELSRISTNSLLALAPGITHDQITEGPPGLSANIMRLVVSAVRSGKPLPSCARSGLPALGAKCLSGAS